MEGGILEKAALAIAGLWVGAQEFRLKNKVSVRECDTRYNHLINQSNRIESHLWDIMQAQKITPSMEPPEEIRNNSKEK
jgi:hypothetical protein